jgi:hypothetical protein
MKTVIVTGLILAMAVSPLAANHVPEHPLICKPNEKYLEICNGLTNYCWRECVFVRDDGSVDLSTVDEPTKPPEDDP